ncbi:hypothetical protein Acr_04g0000400 [Actinidia rufa]|uniref:Uncharacterized protein n=1 Tax=Actinidia rufa TaxID=165716 RepID=A0A7J0EG17_9ERIC|nr:hypothetical protein Acr_04g0000400 [Actinidia rufa]
MPLSLKLRGASRHPVETRQSLGTTGGTQEGCQRPRLRTLASSLNTQLRGQLPPQSSQTPLKLCSPLVLPDFNKVKILDEEADEIPEKSPEVVGELDHEIAEPTKDGTAEDGAAATKDGVAAERAFPNLSPDL